MGLKTTNPKAWSVQKYMVAVLWMEGRESTKNIAKIVNWTDGQVKGFYHREFMKPRVELTIEERQAILDYLRGWSGWFGVLLNARDEHRFKAKQINSERLAKKRQEQEAQWKSLQAAYEAGEPLPKLSKKEMQALQKSEAHRKRQEAIAQAQRELGFAPRGTETDAVQWLYLHALGDKNESLAMGGLSARDRRREALLKFRVHIEGAAISPLRAQDYEAARGAGAKIALPEFRKHCIDMLGGARTILPNSLYVMLDLIVMQDDFVWLRVDAGKPRSEIYTAIRYGADILANYYQIIAPHEFKARWNEEPPRPMKLVKKKDGSSVWETMDMPTRASARADSALAQEIIDELVKAVA